MTSVTEDSPAHYIGLQANDVIIGVNRTKVNNIGELREFFKDREGLFALNVLRGNTTLYLMLR